MSHQEADRAHAAPVGLSSHVPETMRHGIAAQQPLFAGRDPVKAV